MLMNNTNQSLDLMSTKRFVNLFLQEEQKTINSLKHEKANITKAINQIINKIKHNGQVIYLGAGTSGRLGVLDASECRPTFNTNKFLALIAGGKDAIFKAKEGAEDNTKQAIKDLNKIKITKNDVLIGISASGTTPYVISGVRFARKKKIVTIGITSTPNSLLAKLATYKITPDIVSEIISGSSRLRAGTAQKIILNMISSITMIKTGKVYRNLMIDVQPTNKKLINRAIGIISMVCNIPLNKAKVLFEKSKQNTKAAIIMHYKNCNLSKANMVFKRANRNAGAGPKTYQTTNVIIAIMITIGTKYEETKSASL